MVATFRVRREAEAEEIRRLSGKSGPSDLSREHVEVAYKRLTTPDKHKRSEAQKNVTTAFKENRFIQMAGYGMALVLFASGLVLLGRVD